MIFRKTDSLVKKLNVLILTLSTSVFLVATGTSFIHQSNQILSNIKSESENIVTKDVQLLEQEIERYMKNVELVSVDERIRSLDWKTQKKFLEESAEKYGFSAMSFTGVDGILKSTTGAEINVYNSPPYKAFMSGQIVISDPMVSSATGELVMPVAVPTYDAKGNIIGGTATDLDFSIVKNMLDSIKIDNGFCMLINSKGEVISSTKELKSAGKFEDGKVNILELHDKYPSSKKIFEDILKGGKGEANIKMKVHKFYIKYNKLSNKDWHLIAFFPSTIYLTKLLPIAINYLVIAAVFMVINVLITFRLSKYINKRINGVMSLSEKINKNDFTSTADGESSDEIGVITKSINHTVSVLNNLISNLKNLSSIIKKSFDTSSNKIENIQQNIKEISLTTSANKSELKENLNTINNIKDTSQESQKMLTNILNRVKESNSKIDDIKNKAIAIYKQNEELSAQAEIKYKESEEKLLKSIKNIVVVDDIKLMADSIRDIAERTNLLALNASIEASRESSSGFVVVSNEIKTLANQSSAMADKIKKQTNIVIDSVRELTESSRDILNLIKYSSRETNNRINYICDEYMKDGEQLVEIMNELVVDVNNISNNAGLINNRIQEISETISNINISSECIADNVNLLEKNISDVLTSVKDNKESTDELIKSIDKFKTK